MKNTIQIRSAQIHGLEQQEILIEGSKTRGLKQLHLTGLAGPWLRESREKISQVIQEHVSWSPVEKLLIHLLPPEIAKSGAQLEVAIAAACLLLCQEESIRDDQREFLQKHLLVGALSLDGSLVSTPISSMIEATNPDAIGPKRIRDLQQLWEILSNPATFDAAAAPNDTSSKAPQQLVSAPTVEGRSWERLLILSASLAEVPILFLGPPGVGKSHLARWGAATKMPSAAPKALEEIEQIWSLAGLPLKHANPLVTPQPRSHLSEFTGTVSGGASRPGFFALSHGGTLLVDEFTELSKDCREILRFILDEKSFMRSAKSGNVIWPAGFWFLATSNPCACGYSMGEDTSRCRCTESSRHAYRNRFSGPIWDRLGLKIFVSKRETKFSLPESLQSLLDSPASQIHEFLNERRNDFSTGAETKREVLKSTPPFSNTSVRNISLKARLWESLCRIDPSRSESDWLAMLSMHQLTEESWKS